MNRGFKMGLAVTVFLLGVFLIFQWAIKEGSTQESDVQRFNTLLSENKAGLKASADAANASAEAVKTLTEGMKTLETKCVESIAAVDTKTLMVAAEVDKLKKEIEFMRAHQHGMDKRIQGVKREVTINVQSPIPVMFVEKHAAGTSLAKPQVPSPKQPKGKESLLKRSGLDAQ